MCRSRGASATQISWFWVGTARQHAAAATPVSSSINHGNHFWPRYLNLSHLSDNETAAGCSAAAAAAAAGPDVQMQSFRQVSDQTTCSCTDVPVDDSTTCAASVSQSSQVLSSMRLPNLHYQLCCFTFLSPGTKESALKKQILVKDIKVKREMGAGSKGRLRTSMDAGWVVCGALRQLSDHLWKMPPRVLCPSTSRMPLCRCAATQLYLPTSGEPNFGKPVQSKPVQSYLMKADCILSNPAAGTSDSLHSTAVHLAAVPTASCEVNPEGLARSQCHSAQIVKCR